MDTTTSAQGYREPFAHAAAGNADLLVQAVALHQCSGPDLRQSSVASFDEISERDHDAGR